MVFVRNKFDLNNTLIRTRVHKRTPGDVLWFLYRIEGQITRKKSEKSEKRFKSREKILKILKIFVIFEIFFKILGIFLKDFFMISLWLLGFLRLFFWDFWNFFFEIFEIFSTGCSKFKSDKHFAFHRMFFHSTFKGERKRIPAAWASIAKDPLSPSPDKIDSG